MQWAWLLLLVWSGAWADMRFSSPERWVLWNHLDDIAAHAVVLGAWAIPLLFLALLLYAQETRRAGRWLAGAMLCFWATFAHLVPTTWYVRPTAGEYGAEDGTSLAAAFDGTADVVWGVGGVVDGDTLCVAGSFVGTADNDVSGITLRVDTSGSSTTSRVTVDGDCDGDGVKASFDGDNAVGIGIRTAIVGTSRTTYLHIKNIVLRQYTNKAIVTYNVVGDATADAYQTWEGIEVYDHGDGGAGDNGFDSRGRYITLNDSTFSGIDEDAIYHQGKYFTSDGVTVSDFSRATANGDGMQLAGEQDGYHVSNFDCTQAKDAKQCFINSESTDTAANGILEDFVTRCVDGGTVTNCVYVGGTGVIARRGFITGGNYGLVVEGDPDSTDMKVQSVIAKGATVDGIAVFTTAGTGNDVENSIAIDNGRHGIFLATTSAGTITNSVAVGNASCGINRADAGQTESYNDAYSNGTNFCSGSNSTTAGTGSISSDPLWVGGPAPDSPSGFRPSANSPLCGAGTYTDAKYDYNHERMPLPRDIGALNCRSSEARTRSSAGTRTARTIN